MNEGKERIKRWLVITKNTYLAGLQVGLKNSLDYLQNKGAMQYKVITQDYAKQEMEWADVIVFVRDTDKKVKMLLEVARRMGKQILYYVDDSLYDLPLEVRERMNYSADETQKLLEYVIKEVDCLVTCSSWLLKSYEEKFGVEGTWINPAIRPVDIKPFSKKNRPIVVGFAGSTDYTVLLENLRPAFVNLKERYQEKIQFEFFGPKVSFLDEVKALYYSPLAYDIYELVMARRQWDIGIAYNEETVFVNKKFYNKYLEYGRLGIPGIYSDIGLFRRIIKQGENGVLVKNTWEDWMIQIEYMINNEAVRKQIKEKAYEEVLSQFSLEQGARDMRSKLELFL